MKAIEWGIFFFLQKEAKQSQSSEALSIQRRERKKEKISLKRELQRLSCPSRVILHP